jgi:cellulose synthase/poly-beta-1,6-N-acetylglucosamine synthase-like glycosyltransferase
MQNLLKGRNMAVLGGQFSIFSTKALREVLRDSHQRTPWVNDSEVEDSLLSLQIKSAGYLTKISAKAYAHVGGMTTLRSLDGQQVKWNYGAIDLMWPGQRGDTRVQPLHPNLRLRWFEHASMVLNIFTRLGFLMLLFASLSISAFVFRAWWVIPPIAAIWLNMRVARSMAFANRRDYLFAVLMFPAEFYMWIRMGHFVRAWLKFFSRQQTDNWAAQAKAERGKGTAYLYPFLSLLVFLVAAGAIWVQLPVNLRSDILSVCWPILGVLTVVQTAWMALKSMRRYRGFKA